MARRWSLLLGSAALATMLLAATADAHGPGGGHGGGANHGGAYHGGPYHGGPYHGGPYHGGAFYYGGFYGPRLPYYGPYGFPVNYGYGLYAPYGFYRPYYGYGLGGGGLGLGGLGLGGLGLGGLGGGGYGAYAPYYGGPVVAVPGAGSIPPTTPPAAGNLSSETPPPPEAPPVDNAAHLQLIVPENAEVLFDGSKTTKTGTTREFVSPPLPPGKAFSYTITVRSTDANGKVNTDKRVINVHANDWFRIDFTQPAPPEPVPAP